VEPLADRIAAVRQFNRFYTQRIGVLRDGFADSPFSLTQARVLYDILHREQATASEIGAELGLDAGYLSRMLRDLVRRGLIAKERSRQDARQIHVTVTARGRKAFAPLEAHSQAEVGAMLRTLASDDQARLVLAMQTVRQLLTGVRDAEGYILRPHQPGDMGWIVSRHGTLYAEEQGWDHRLEAVAAEIVATFLRRFDPERERCWMAERKGERLGCVMLVKESARVARLRLLLVEPSARGLGIGKRLVDECIAFARAAGYRRITLWTHTVLTAARRIYQGAGFRLVKTWHHDEFGKMLESESWELKL
jgi:DNA-binding MarR family transcriptional regulator/N-acetylglutamate synthase-like GNAT family acetyltransferase